MLDTRSLLRMTRTFISDYNKLEEEALSQEEDHIDFLDLCLKNLTKVTKKLRKVDKK